MEYFETINTRAIVLYLDYNMDQFSMFRMFLKSIELANVKDTDIVVFYNPELDMFVDNEVYEIGIGGNIIFLSLPPVSNTIPFKNYNYINSIHCLTNQNWLQRYKYILRTDLDTLLTEKWNNVYPEKDQFLAGRGRYNNDRQTEDRIAFVEKKYGYSRREDYLKNIGSTWYGSSDQVLGAAELTVKLCAYFLQEEFKNSMGEWPGYYKLVSTLYASEIAVNNVAKDIIIDQENFDFESTSSNQRKNHVHIHCWHTDENFSKFKFFNGEYKELEIEKLNLDIVKDYCTFCAITGNSE